MGATWESDRGDDGLVGVLVYVLSPEKFVLTAAFGDAGVVLSFALILFDARRPAASNARPAAQPLICRAHARTFGPPSLLQLAGEAAFITAILPGQGLPAPLLVGYVVTALASITLPIGVFVASRRKQDEEREKSKSGQPLRNP